MANPVCDVLLTDAPLRAVDVDLDCGALVEFQGIVRPREGSREIDGIDYEAHATMAKHQLQSIAHEAAEKFELMFVQLHHRTGFVGAGEASLLLRVASTHRAAAFEASQWIVDELKKRVTIWKRPRNKVNHRPAAEPATATV